MKATILTLLATSLLLAGYYLLLDRPGIKTSESLELQRPHKKECDQAKRLIQLAKPEGSTNPQTRGATADDPATATKVANKKALDEFRLRGQMRIQIARRQHELVKEAFLNRTNPKN